MLKKQKALFCKFLPFLPLQPLFESNGKICPFIELLFNHLVQTQPINLKIPKTKSSLFLCSFLLTLPSSLSFLDQILKARKRNTRFPRFSPFFRKIALSQFLFWVLNHLSYSWKRFILAPGLISKSLRWLKNFVRQYTDPTYLFWEAESSIASIHRFRRVLRKLSIGLGLFLWSLYPHLHLCIVLSSSKEALDHEECSFYKNVQNLKHSQLLKHDGRFHIWDIEDLVELGKKKGGLTLFLSFLALFSLPLPLPLPYTIQGCPYFASRSLAHSAEVIFCPYNYLIDPSPFPFFSWTPFVFSLPRADCSNLDR